MKFRKKPVVIDADQWFKNGDHPAVSSSNYGGSIRHDDCLKCGHIFADHGLINTLESSVQVAHEVCPGDWIITGVKGENYACKPDIFAATYEPAE